MYGNAWTHVKRHTTHSQKYTNQTQGIIFSLGYSSISAWILIEFAKIALWTCSYGPWAILGFSSASWFRLSCFTSDIFFLWESMTFQIAVVFIESRNLQIGRRPPRKDGYMSMDLLTLPSNHTRPRFPEAYLLHHTLPERSHVFMFRLRSLWLPIGLSHTE